MVPLKGLEPSICDLYEKIKRATSPSSAAGQLIVLAGDEGAGRSEVLYSAVNRIYREFPSSVSTVCFSEAKRKRSLHGALEAIYEQIVADSRDSDGSAARADEAVSSTPFHELRDIKLPEAIAAHLFAKKTQSIVVCIDDLDCLYDVFEATDSGGVALHPSELLPDPLPRGFVVVTVMSRSSKKLMMDLKNRYPSFEVYFTIDQVIVFSLVCLLFLFALGVLLYCFFFY